MRVLLVLVVGLGLVACNGPDIKVPISKFLGSEVNVSSYETIRFDISGAYIYNNKTKDCVKGGTWKDNNPGDRSGTITFTQKADGCVYPNSTEEVTYTYSYKVDDKNIITLVQ